MILQSPAKVNLGLRIVGRRTDGYHLLESVFWPIDLCDEIQIEKSSKNRVSMAWEPGYGSGINLPEQNENSIYKLLTRNPELGTWCVHIRKRIPIGGGLGGSSSNAGTLLKFLVNQHSLETTIAAKVALSLGADVPFFLQPQPTWIEGIGERRSVLPSHSKLKLAFHLLIFETPCITKRIFDTFRESGTSFSQSHSFKGIPTDESFLLWLKDQRNDLERFAILNVPEIGRALSFLRELNLPYVGMTGSGSTCFGVSTGDSNGKKASKDLQQFCRMFNCRYIEANTFDA